MIQSATGSLSGSGLAHIGGCNHADGGHEQNPHIHQHRLLQHVDAIKFDFLFLGKPVSAVDLSPPREAGGQPTHADFGSASYKFRLSWQRWPRSDETEFSA